MTTAANPAATVPADPPERLDRWCGAITTKERARVVAGVSDPAVLDALADTDDHQVSVAATRSATGSGSQRSMRWPRRRTSALPWR